MSSCSSGLAQVLPPGISWKRSDRINFYPAQAATTPATDIDFISEDWWYDHKNSYEGGVVDPENFNGFITCGYSAIRNTGITEDNDGCHQTSLESPPNGVTCYEELDFAAIDLTDGVLGHETFQTLAKYDIYGKLEWFKSYNQLWFIRVIQTSDGNYVAVGPTRSTREPDNVTPLYYNPTAITTDAFGDTYGNTCTGFYNRKVNVVKVDPEGNVIWNYIYGVKAIGTDCAMERVMPYDIVEYDQGTSSPKLRVVGRYQGVSGGTPIPYHSGFMIDINSNDGYWNWSEIFDPANTSGTDARTFKAIEKVSTGSGEYLGIAGTETQSGQKILDVIYVSTSSMGPVTPAWQVYYNGTTNPTTSTTDIQTDVHDLCIDSNGDLLIPVLYNCNDCAYVDNWSEAAVFKIDKSNGGVLAQYQISDGTTASDLARAFDLKIGITNTADGGFAIVTSKRPQDFSTRYDPYTFSWNCDGNHPRDESYYSYWGADAFVRKFDDAGNIEWSKTWDIDDAAPEAFPGDQKKQECMYSISETPDGGLVVSGNNSRNFDDCYLVKLYDNCINNVKFDLAAESEDGIIEVDEITSSLGQPVFDQNLKIRGSIVIHDGEQLEIKNSAIIEFADTRKCGIITNIVVEEGGSLIINEGATLTSIDACDNSMWDGVQIWGDNSIDQSSGQANMFISDDATIENARVGILGDKGRYVLHENIPGPNQAMIKDLVLEGWHTHGGALLQADDANFRNNRFSVNLHAYPGFSNNSYIQNSDFLLDQPINDFDAVNSSGDRLGINTFIVLFDVHGIIIDQNDFDVTHSFTMNHDKGVGLGAFNSTVQVTQNHFKKLELGAAIGSSTSAYGVFGARCNNFEDVNFGIDVRNAYGMQIHDNTMTVDDGAYPFGIYMEECSNYLVQDNTLSFVGQPSITGEFGIINYRNTLLYSSEFIKYNTITDFANSFLLEGNHIAVGGSASGLKLNCNTLTASLYDINVGLAPGIAGNQNGSGSGANNIFTTNGCNVAEGQIHNPSGMNPIDYHHKLNNGSDYVEPASGCYTASGQVVPNAINNQFVYNDDCLRPLIGCSPQFTSVNSSNQSSAQTAHLRKRFNSTTTDPDLLRNEKIQYYLHNRGIAGSMDSVIALLESDRSLYGSQLAIAYSSVGDSQAYANQLTILENDPAYTNFVRLSRMLSSANWSVLRTDTAALSTLRQIAADTLTLGSTEARNVLMHLFNEYYSPVIVFDKSSQHLRKKVENSDSEIEVFPNPFSTTLTVDLPDAENVYDMRIFSILGNEVLYVQSSGTRQAVLEIGNLSQGLFLLVISKNGQIVFSKKINHLN